MGTRGRAGAVALLCALVLACAGGTGGERHAAGDAASAGDGAALFRTNCASCHGIDARGGGPLAPALHVPAPDLTRIAARRGGVFPDAAVLRQIDGRDPVIAHGPREMPVWGEHFGAGLESSPGVAAETARRGRALLLVEYLRSLQRP